MVYYRTRDTGENSEVWWYPYAVSEMTEEEEEVAGKRRKDRGNKKRKEKEKGKKGKI